MKDVIKKNFLVFDNQEGRTKPASKCDKKELSFWYFCGEIKAESFEIEGKLKWKSLK